MILQTPLTDNSVAVCFRLPASIWGDQVMLVGDFNGWSTRATPMRQGEQYWEARLILRAGEHYAYAYLIDGVDWCSESPPCERAAGPTPPVEVTPLDIAQVRHRVAAS
jgi:1,4-alpha-glucan branching enzyme